MKRFLQIRCWAAATSLGKVVAKTSNDCKPSTFATVTRKRAINLKSMFIPTVEIMNNFCPDWRNIRYDCRAGLSALVLWFFKIKVLEHNFNHIINLFIRQYMTYASLMWNCAHINCKVVKMHKFCGFRGPGHDHEVLNGIASQGHCKPNWCVMAMVYAHEKIKLRPLTLPIILQACTPVGTNHHFKGSLLMLIKWQGCPIMWEL